MTNEQGIKCINEIREILADYRALTSYDHEALDIAISALSKQSASSEQVKILADVLDGRPITEACEKLGEPADGWCEINNCRYKEYPSAECWLEYARVMAENKTESDHIAKSDKMVDQFRDSAKKTDSERVSLSEQEKSNSFSEKPSEEGNSEMNCSDVPDIHVGKTDFKPGGNPGIIHCKDCKKFVKDHFNIPYCYRDPGCKWNENDYCSKAESRNDG